MRGASLAIFDERGRSQRPRSIRRYRIGVVLGQRKGDTSQSTDAIARGGARRAHPLGHSVHSIDQLHIRAKVANLARRGTRHIGPFARLVGGAFSLLIRCRKFLFTNRRVGTCTVYGRNETTGWFVRLSADGNEGFVEGRGPSIVPDQLDPHGFGIRVE